MKKDTQWDLVTLALAEKGGWQHAYVFKGYPIKGQFVGSEADTRLYDLFDKDVKDNPEQTTSRRIGEEVYTIETKKDGNNRMYRAYLSGKKPQQVVTFVEVDGERVARISYV